jgi:serine/threonine-protein kinase
MGSVWLARRSDGLFEGAAAVKLLNASLVGRAGEERFRREGGILARLEHPHIAHLLDAGVSPTGQPYLVLEHVAGEAIDRYCDQRALAVDERVRLFLDVLDAVALAHANLIVHRDIKPANVLVRGDGEVKLLDFGIAKLLEGDTSAGEASALTREGGRALTPEYAAPEQLTGGRITTATDVYSLGVLLYLLLSGRHPAGAALDSPAELLRAIVDTEPEPVSRAAAAEQATAGATADGASPERLRRALRGDLDTVVAKALKKSPQERYSSVTSFADDLRRYLNHEPVSARPDTLAYRAARFVRRNRAPVALAVVAALALVAGLAGTLSQARRADRQARAAREQRDFALRQLSRAEAINDLDAFLLTDAAPSGRPFTAGELLARAEQVVERQKDEADENRVEMLISIGRQYHSQDQHAEARRLLTRAYELASRLPEPAIRAKAACTLASTIALSGELQRAESLVEEARRELPEEPQFALDRLNCLLRGSEVARARGDPEASLARVKAAQRLLQEAPASALLDLRVSMELASSYQLGGRNREASAAFERAAARLSALGRDDTDMASTLFNNWALALRALGRTLDAERAMRRAIRISSTDGTERGVQPMPLNNLARLLCELHRLPEAASYAERAHAQALRAGSDIVANQSLLVRAAIYREQGRLSRAAEMLAEVGPRLERTLPAGHVAFAALALEQGLLAQASGDSRAALADLDKAVAIAEASPQGPSLMSTLLLGRSASRLAAGRPDDAGADAARALEQQARDPGASSSRLGRAFLALARARRSQGRVEEAQRAAASAFEQLLPSLGAGHPDTREARQLATIEAPDR